MMRTNRRIDAWLRLTAAAMAGFCMGGGCSSRGYSALLVGLEAAADELRDDDDDTLFDWLEEQLDDGVDDLEDLID